MPKVTIARADADELPELCLVTGSPANVRYREIAFDSVADRDGEAALVFAQLLLAMVHMHVPQEPREEIVLRLPLTTSGWWRWKLGKPLVGLSCVLGLGLMLAGGMLLSTTRPWDSGAPGGLLMLASPLVPLLVYLQARRGWVRLLASDARTLSLWVPSEAAARAIEEAARERGGERWREKGERLRDSKRRRGEES